MKLNHPFMQVAWKYTMTGLLLYLLVFFGMYFIGVNPIGNSRFLDFIILPLFIFFAVKEFKNLNGGILHFWQGMSLGFLIYFPVSVLYSLFVYLFIVVEGQVLVDFIQTQYDSFLENKENLVGVMGQEIYDQTLVQIQKISIADVSLDELLKKNMLGFFFATIISVIFRKTDTFVNKELKDETSELKG